MKKPLTNPKKCIIISWYTETYRSGRNENDSKGSRAYHSRERKISRFLRLSRKCFIFLEFWMNAFQLRPCKSRAKFKHNLIRRDIEVVITGLTRNQFVRKHTWVRIPLSPPKGLHKIDAPTENPDFIGVFAVFTVKKHKGRMTDENRLFCLNREI